MRIDPYKLKRPDILIEKKDIEDPLQPGQTLSLTLRADPSRGAQSKRDEDALRYAQKFLPVSEAEAEAAAKRGDKPRTPERIAATGGTPAIVTQEICTEIAFLIDMQSVTAAPGQVLSEDEKPFSFAEWVLIAERMPNAYEEALAFAGELMLRAEGKRPNAPKGPDTPPPSGSPSSDAA